MGETWLVTSPEAIQKKPPPSGKSARPSSANSVKTMSSSPAYGCTTTPFVDLFAGIGGFHGALAGMGGRSLLAAESDKFARAVYERNWSINDFPERVEEVARTAHHLDDFEVLTAGFPCQPFSKPGLQMGMEETRGTLF